MFPILNDIYCTLCFIMTFGLPEGNSKCDAWLAMKTSLTPPVRGVKMKYTETSKVTNNPFRNTGDLSFSKTFFPKETTERVTTLESFNNRTGNVSKAVLLSFFFFFWCVMH